MRKPPAFWREDGLLPRLLAPAAALVAAATRRRRRQARPWQAPVPVLCVGNLVAGGAGKTPVALDMAQRLQARGLLPAFLSRGYGGSATGPLQVDPAAQSAAEVGDEPLLLARIAPTWVARDRVAGAKAAIAAGATALVLDDGFQNPALAKSLSLLVVDGGQGLGNGRVLPAGPLRETPADALARADAVVLLGEATPALLRSLAGPPLLAGRLAPIPAARRLRGEKVVAFAGIGRPEKLFATLRELGARIAAEQGFPDHHPYEEKELLRLAALAEQAGARLVTTEKDAMRLPPAWRLRVSVVPVVVEWRDPAALEALLESKGFRR